MLVTQPEYHVWRAMVRRCMNHRAKDWHYYGGRGITVCKRWLEYANFLADMGQRTSAIYTLDRIDNQGNYEPSNCRWATRSDQQRNRRQRHIGPVCKDGHFLSPSSRYKRFSMPGRTDGAAAGSARGMDTAGHILSHLPKPCLLSTAQKRTALGTAACF